jgi:hypothetical protein
MPRGVLRVVDEPRSLGVIHQLRIVDLCLWTGEGSIHKAKKEMTSENLGYLSTPIQIIVVAKSDGDERSEVEGAGRS